MTCLRYHQLQGGKNVEYNGSEVVPPQNDNYDDDPIIYIRSKKEPHSPKTRSTNSDNTTPVTVGKAKNNEKSETTVRSDAHDSLKDADETSKKKGEGGKVSISASCVDDTSRGYTESSPAETQTNELIPEKGKREEKEQESSSNDKSLLQTAKETPKQEQPDTKKIDINAMMMCYPQSLIETQNEGDDVIPDMLIKMMSQSNISDGNKLPPMKLMMQLMNCRMMQLMNCNKNSLDNGQQMFPMIWPQMSKTGLETNPIMTPIMTAQMRSMLGVIQPQSGIGTSSEVDQPQEYEVCADAPNAEGEDITKSDNHDDNLDSREFEEEIPDDKFEDGSESASESCTEDNPSLSVPNEYSPSVTQQADEALPEQEQNVENDSIPLPLDMQIANNIVKSHHILLVRDIETGKRIPHFYKENRYVADPNFETIRGFIKNEIIALFTGKTDVLARYQPDVLSEKNKKDYKQKEGFVNHLTRNVVKNIQDISELLKEECEFDADPFEINTLNGILDIRTGKLLPHTPDKLLRNIVNAHYLELTDKLEPLNVFLDFISDSLFDKTKDEQENSSVVSSFLQILASFLIGNNEHKLAYILMGLPNTGKSTLLAVLRGIFGDYGTSFNNSVLMISSRTVNDIRPDIIALRGKRLLVGSEANKANKFDNALVKQISGNDEMSYRKPRSGEMIKFVITGKMMLATNYCPDFSDLDDIAFLNRIVLIDFNNVPDKLDVNLKDKLLTQDSRNAIFTLLAGYANGIVARGKIYIHERFVTNKQRILVNQNSSVSLFWKEHIRPEKGYFYPDMMAIKHPIKVLYSEMYLKFCKRINIEPLMLNAFAKEFKELSDQFTMVTWKKGESHNFYTGFLVVGENANEYYNTLNVSIMDKVSNKSSRFQ
jgi:P4 family phage/plasmid primase-like protien